MYERVAGRTTDLLNNRSGLATSCGVFDSLVVKARCVRHPLLLSGLDVSRTNSLLAAVCRRRRALLQISLQKEQS